MFSFERALTLPLGREWFSFFNSPINPKHGLITSWLYTQDSFLDLPPFPLQADRFQWVPLPDRSPLSLVHIFAIDP